MKILKHSLFLFLCLSTSTTALTQVIDAKLEPFSALLSRNIKLGAEIAVTNDIGIDLDAVYNFNVNIPVVGISVGGSGFGVRLIPRYYFNPISSIDRFYLGPYLKYRQDKVPGFKLARAKLGIFSGYKIVSKNNIVFDFGIGFGRRIYRNLSDDLGEIIDDQFEDLGTLFALDLTGKIAIGYRFGGTPNSQKSKPAVRQRTDPEMGIDQEEFKEERKSSDDRRKKGKKKKKKRRN